MWLFVIGTLVWVVFIADVLSRKDIEPVERLIWLVTVIFVPLFGILLYLVMAPAKAGAKAAQLPDGQSRGLPDAEKKVNLRSDVAGTPWEDDPGHIA